MVPYSINPADFSLERIKFLIQDRKLFASRQLLKVGIDEKFELLKQSGIHNLKSLNSALNNSGNVNLSKMLGIDPGYFVQLKREANSFLSKPVSIDAFPGLDLRIINSLKKAGIKTSKNYFEQVQILGFKQLSEQNSGSVNELIELFSLCDLSRIWGVGPVFARIVYESGILCVNDFKTADPVLAYKLFIEINNRLKLTKALFIDSDIAFCIRMANELACVDFQQIINS